MSESIKVERSVNEADFPLFYLSAEKWVVRTVTKEHKSKKTII